MVKKMSLKVMKVSISYVAFERENGRGRESQMVL